MRLDGGVAVRAEEASSAPDRVRGRPAVSPLAKLGAALALGICLILTIDWVSAGTALLLEVLCFPLLGIGVRRAFRRVWPVLLAAPLAAVTIALYGEASGTVHAEFWLVLVTDGSLDLAVATALRVLAIGLPAVLLFVSVDPTDLADGLAQVLRLQARFVLGALAGVRLVGLLLDDWRMLGLARRARGIADRGRLRRAAGQGFALLVLAVRRGSKLATAMEARGFGAARQRTWARSAGFTVRDGSVVTGGLAIGLIAIAATVATGHWNFIAG